MSVRVNRLPHNELREQLARSGQNAESFAADLAAQPELLAAAAELLKKRNGEVASIQSDLEAPATSAKKKSKKASKAVLDELLGGLKDGGTTTASAACLGRQCRQLESGAWQPHLGRRDGDRHGGAGTGRLWHRDDASGGPARVGRRRLFGPGP